MKVILKLILVKAMLITLVLPMVACNYDAKKMAVIFANNPAGIYDNSTTTNFKQAMTAVFSDHQVINNPAVNTNETGFWKTILMNNVRQKTKYFMIFNKNFLIEINNLIDELKKNMVTGNKIITLDYENNDFNSVEISNLTMLKFDLIKMGYTLGYYTGQHLLAEAKSKHDKLLKVSAITYQSDLVAQRLISGWQQGLVAAQSENEMIKIEFVDPIAKINNYDPPNPSDVSNVMLTIAEQLLGANVKVIFDPLSLHRASLMQVFLKNTIKDPYLVTIDVVNENKFTVNQKKFLLAYVNRDFKPALNTIATKDNRDLLTDFDFNSSIIGSKVNVNFNHDQFDQNQFLWKKMSCNQNDAPLSQHFCQDGS